LKKLKYKRKRFLINKCKKQLRHRTKRKNKRYQISGAGKKIELRKKPEFRTVEAPKNLTLKFEHSEDVLKFIKKIKQYGERGYFIDLRLEKVESIAEGAIAMLLSVISDLERQRIFFTGKKPKNAIANDILERSGLFEHMKGSVSKNNKISKNKILKTGNIKTHQKELVPEIHKAMETIWGVSARCPDLYSGIGEMMRNSCDHAFVKKNSTLWHLGISHFEDTNCCKFSFLDNGEGIIKTYTKKGLLSSIASFFNNNAEILDTAFKDGIRSKTGLSWRGKGLPTIFEMYTDNIITNLIVITNDVYLDFDRKISKTMPTSFSGTYYFWKIDKTCEPYYFK
jgi:hypothetical protein